MINYIAVLKSAISKGIRKIMKANKDKMIAIHE